MSPAKRAPKRKRQRRTPAAARNAVLETARVLLLEAGPQAITLPAVARRLGMAHGNITHHFGSVSALHACLVDQMAHELTAEVVSAVMQLRTAGAEPVEVVMALFNAFSRSDAGRLISWLASTGNMEALEPLFGTVSKVVHDLSQGHEDRELSIRQNALVLITAALGNAIIGDRLHAALALPPGTLEQLSAADLVRRTFRRES